MAEKSTARAEARAAAPDDAPDETPQERALVREEQAEARAEGRQFSRSNVQTAMGRMPADPALYEVMVDTFGSRVQHTRGDILRPDDSPYDLEEAATRGVVRKLTVAEVRSDMPSFTRPLTGDNRSVDWDQQASGRYFAGLPAADDPLRGPNGERATVTGPEGPKEDPDLAKPTIPNFEGGEPPINPVLTVKSATHEDAIRDHFADARERAAKAK